MQTVEQYAINLVADGAQSHAEDDMNEDGNIDDTLHSTAVGLAQNIARALRMAPTEAVIAFTRTYVTE